MTRPARPSELLNGKSLVSFDVGFTLIEPNPSVGEVYAGVARRMGFDLDAEELGRRFHEVYRQRLEEARRDGKPSIFNDSEEQTRAWWLAVCSETLTGSLPPGHRELVAREIYDEFGRGRSWRLFDDVLEALEAIGRRGLRLVAISNWDRRLETTLRDLGLDRFFERVYISSVIGCEKPSPEIFQRMLNDCGVEPSEVVHIGDGLEDDAAGARSVGIQPILILRRDDETPPEDLPTVRSLRELA